MSLTTFSDLGQFQTMRRDSAQLKADLSRLTSELSSGRISDISGSLGGDFSALSGITRSLRLNETYLISVREAALAAEGRQAALERVSAEMEGFAPAILTMTGSGSLSDLQLTLADAPDRFEQAVDAVNTRLAGRSLFSADRPDQSPLMDGRAILDELATVVAAAPDAATVVADVTAWFEDAGGGLETFAWNGGLGDAPKTLIAEGRTAETGVTALDPALRETLASLALAALAQENPAALNEPELRSLVTEAGEKIINSEERLIALRAKLGAEEARIEEARVTAETARTGLQTEYNRIVSADPYDTATQLETLSTRLESLYILTSRLSRLSLTEYIR